MTARDASAGTDSPDSLTDARTLLVLMGFDPDSHHFERSDGPWPGLRVVEDATGERVAFFTLRQMRHPRWQRRMDAIQASGSVG